ncbi:MAG: class I SAM-dependent methyltransferase [Actinobacteria bacterium]|jgi:SAM-dependent methyltransferase|nr:MAG: class I SAM-dependent methyltransferase [Actinomycetota bacterium]
MGRKEIYSDYDDFAWFYNHYWGGITANPPMLDVLDRLLFSRLPRGAKVLDICCGTGQLDAVLAQRGFAVTGIDGSACQLEYARHNAPGCEFIHADVRDFNLAPAYDAAISIFDSLNHILTLEGLERAFLNVHKALVPGGCFLFDLNMEEGLHNHWKGFNAQVEDDNAFVMRLAYDPEERIARADTTMFRREGEAWRRSDSSFTQTAYAQEEIFASLIRGGFVDISASEALQELGRPMGEDRTFFLARKPGASPR